MSGTSEHKTWDAMIQRCENPKCAAYKNYGGRGIKVCARWRRSFEAFYEDMGQRPKGLTIERIDNEGNYKPGNCKWATRQEQCNNYRHNQFIEHDGKRLTITQWAREVGMQPETLRHRIKYGWPVERALTEQIDTSKWTQSYVEKHGRNFSKPTIRRT